MIFLKRPAPLSREQKTLEGRKKSQNGPFKSIFNNFVRDLGGISDLRTHGHYKDHGIGDKLVKSVH